MQFLYYECFSGISGDMNLGALLDLGLPFDYLLAELKKLGVEGYSITQEKSMKNGIEGTKCIVKCDEHHHHRKFSDIRKIIEKSSLNDNIKKLAVAIFEKVAEAEAKIHGKSVEEVHFHEVGAVDSIVDIVGAAIAIDYFKPEKIISTPVELGSGFAQCAHGQFPVPAPATAEILKDVPVTAGNQPFEATTPTGAAIIKTLANEFSASSAIKMTKTAYGIGHKSADIPNVLRVSLCQPAAHDKKPHHKMIECNIDDMNPELTGYIMEKMLNAGADDVFITPIIMKKSRNGSKISVLCKTGMEKQMIDLLLSETTTFGVRFYDVGKTMLERDFIKTTTKYGEVNVKRAFLNGTIVKQKPEYEDCLAISKEKNVPIQKVYEEIEKSFSVNE